MGWPGVLHDQAVAGVVWFARQVRGYNVVWRVSSHDWANRQSGELRGALPEWGLIGSSSIDARSSVGEGISRREKWRGERRRKEKRKEEKESFKFLKLEFILFSVFQNEISFLRILTRVFDI